MTDRNALLGLMQRIAATSLPGSSQREPVRVPAAAWPRLLSRVVQERLSGLAVAAAQHGWLGLDDDQFGELLEHHRAAMLWTLRVERTLLVVSRHLEARGVRPIVLKGSALAHTLYPDPSWRAFRDLDLLVRTRQWKAACSALEALGMRRRLPEPRPGFDERFGKAAVYVGSEGYQVDLHRTLAQGPFGQWMDPEELFARTTPFELAGRRLHRLDDTALLLHACVHASLGWTPPQLLPLRDVAQVSTAGDVDWASLEALAAQWRLTAVLGHAFGVTLRAFGPVLPSRVRRLMDMEVPPEESRALLAYTTDGRWRGATEWSTLRALKGARTKAAYVRALLFPKRQFVKARTKDGEAGSYLRRWAVPMRRILRP
jgi:putative nucleotidyltransferase-like protein